MARVAPEAAVEHASRVGRVRLEARELEVAHALEAEPEREEEDADAIEQAQRALARGEQSDLDGQRDRPLQEPLQSEYGGEAHPGKTRAPVPPHRLVARVFAMPRVSPEQVCAEAKAPDERHPEQQARSAPGARRHGEGDPGLERDPRAPPDVDDAGVAEAQAEEPEQHDRRNSAAERGGERGTHSSFFRDRQAARRSAIAFSAPRSVGS
jgi:hypothetical protein